MLNETACDQIKDEKVVDVMKLISENIGAIKEKLGIMYPKEQSSPSPTNTIMSFMFALKDFNGDLNEILKVISSL
jgi:hypothetical protein